jgi:hypothetical protein
MPDREHYLDVLEDLDSGDYDVSGWEAEFIENILKHRPYALSDRQAAVIQRMALKYLGEELSL